MRSGWHRPRSRATRSHWRATARCDPCNAAPGGADSVAFLGDDLATNNNKFADYAWTTGGQHRLTLTRHGNQCICVVVGPSGTTTLMRSSNVLPGDGNTVDLFAFGATAQYGSVQIIGKQ
jgi:hypothetical protein